MKTRKFTTHYLVVNLYSSIIYSMGPKLINNILVIRFQRIWPVHWLINALRTSTVMLLWKLNFGQGSIGLSPLQQTPPLMWQNMKHYLNLLVSVTPSVAFSWCHNARFYTAAIVFSFAVHQLFRKLRPAIAKLRLHMPTELIISPSFQRNYNIT